MVRATRNVLLTLPALVVAGAAWLTLDTAMPDFESAFPVHLSGPFLGGHRIVGQGQSSRFPLAGVNLQSLEPIPGAATSSIAKATKRGDHAAAAASSLVLQVPDHYGAEPRR